MPTKEYFKTYRKENRKRLIEYSREYYAKYRDVINARRRARYATDSSYRESELLRKATKRLEKGDRNEI